MVEFDFTQLRGRLENAKDGNVLVTDLERKALIERVLRGAVDGKSAYEIAVENGFKGTEQKWLASLKGISSYEHETVTTRPAVGKPNVIYNIPDTDAWTEEIYVDGSWLVLATHANEAVGMELFTPEEYEAISPKKFKYYFVAKDATDKEKGRCWKIYLRTQLVGTFNVDGSLTLPRFPMRFPFRLA